LEAVAITPGLLDGLDKFKTILDKDDKGESNGKQSEKSQTFSNFSSA
jgi:hypothetical protein